MATRLRKKTISKARTGLTTLLAPGSANYQTDSDPQKEVSQEEGRGAEKGEIPRATLAKGELFFFPGKRTFWNHDSEDNIPRKRVLALRRKDLQADFSCNRWL